MLSTTPTDAVQAAADLKQALAEKPVPSSVKMDGGVVVTVLLKSKPDCATDVFVRFLPARHLKRYLELRDENIEALMLEFTVQCNSAAPGGSPIWKSPDPADAKQLAAHAAFIDDLEDDSHLQLVRVADWLNFLRAVSQAEREIAMGHKMLPLRERQAATLLKPVEGALKLLVSSLGIAPPKTADASKP